MTLDSLRCFCAVVESGSFRAAAERVHVSQPAVSQQLKGLERELGQSLIDRRTGKPTAPGEAAYARARALLLGADGLAREMRDWDEAAARELRVGAGDTVALYVLPRIVRAFARRLPRTRLVLVNRGSEAVTEGVLRGALDLGVVTMPEPHEGLESKTLFEERLVLTVPKGHRLIHKRGIVAKDLHREAFLLLEETTRTGALLRAHFARVGFSPEVALDSASFEVIKRYVAAGAGVAILPDTVLSPGDAGVSVVRMNGLPRVPIGAIWRNDARPNSARDVLLELLARAGSAYQVQK